MEMVDINRKLLREAGYPDATVSRWATGHRIPRAKTAVRLSEILSVPVSRIPHRVEVVI